MNIKRIKKAFQDIGTDGPETRLQRTKEAAMSG